MTRNEDIADLFRHAAVALAVNPYQTIGRAICDLGPNQRIIDAAAFFFIRLFGYRYHIADEDHVFMLLWAALMAEEGALE